MDRIACGEVPPATQALRYYEFELQTERCTYFLKFLDYPGELFRKVFYESTVDSDEARQLYDLSTSADAVIALCDPKSVLDGTWDIDYAFSNLVRFYKSEGRKEPFFVLAFTKRDQTQDFVGRRVSRFVRKRLPHLAAELARGVRIQHFCSFISESGRIVLASPNTVTAPLRSVIDALESERSEHDREAFLRRIAWKRTAVRVSGVLIVLVIVIVAFVVGVLSRPG
ncbi:MAG: hypothetical protein IH897_10045 [Planctomycetes bacterium]|nr:hypothetical protein [Planctomycetota bacterium]